VRERAAVQDSEVGHRSVICPKANKGEYVTVTAHLE
jgi:hypothetical protein